MLRSRMGFGALAIVIAVLAVVSSLIPVMQVHALLPGGAAGAYSVTASFADSAHISVIASGTYSPNANTNLDMSSVQGLYFNGNVAPDGSQWPITAGSGTKYWFDNNKNSTCKGNNSDIVITSYTPGNVTATFNFYIPETNSTAATGTCYAVSMTGQSVIDTSAGGNINTFHITSVSAGRGGPSGSQYSPVTLGADASTANYYEASGTQIYAAADDPSMGGGAARYVFTQTTVNGQTVYKQSAGSGVGTCPDEIALSTTTGLFIQGKYTTWGEGTSCNSGSAGTTYDILVLGETPGAYFSNLGGGSSADGGANGQTAAPPDTCPIQNWALRWLVCPVLVVIDNSVSVINSYLNNLLTIPTAWFVTTAEPGKAYFAAWGDFRDIAVSLIVIAALIMVIGESAGFDLLDAYSIRKILPRLLTAAIAMSLSWVICTFVIQLFNNLNNWLPDIILSPFQALYSNGAALTPTGVLGTIETAGGVGLGIATLGTGVVAALVILSIPGILSLLLTLFIAMIIAFVTLTIRTMIILLWLITAPIGIACYILPTTQIGYKFWRDAGVSAFVAGLAVVTFIAAGQLVAIVTITGKGVVPVLAPVAIIVSYMMIGTAFRAAGGLVGNAAGAVHGFHKGVLSKQSEFRRGLPKKRLEQAEHGYFKGGLGSKFNDKISQAVTAPKAISSMGYGAAGAVFSKSGRKNLKDRLETTHGDHVSDAATHIMKEDEDVTRWMGDDGFDKAVSGTIGPDAEYGNDRAAVEKVLKEHYFGDANYDMNDVKNFDNDPNQMAQMQSVISQTTDRAMRVKHKYGDSQALKQATTRANAGTGTGFKDTELNSDRDDHREQIRKYLYAEDANGNRLHENGKHFDVIEAKDKNGMAIQLKDANNNPIFERDGKNNILVDTQGNKIVATKKKVVIHDATGKMYKAIDEAAGHDRGVAVNMFAEMRDAANRSGRNDLGGAGFGDGVGALFAMSDAIHAAKHDSTLSPEAVEAKIRDATVDATSKALKSAAEGLDAAVQSGGKPYSAEALARTHFSEVKDQYAKWQDAQQKGLPPQVVELEYRDLVQKSAAAMNVYDSFRGRSRLNASTSANSLTGNVIAGTAGIPPAPGATPSPQDVTVLQWFDSIQHLPAWKQIRQDIGLQAGSPNAPQPHQGQPVQPGIQGTPGQPPATPAAPVAP